MNEANPYAVPSESVDGLCAIHAVVDDTPVFSPGGRFSRLSYIAWMFLLFGGMSLAIFLFWFGGNLESEGVIGFLGVVLIFVIGPVSVMFTVRRLHDIGWSGWLWLVTLVPLVKIIMYFLLVFVPGETGIGSYGPPRRTRTWEKAVAWIAIVAVVGVFMAIAIPMAMDHYNEMLSSK